MENKKVFTIQQFIVNETTLLPCLKKKVGEK